MRAACVRVTPTNQLLIETNQPTNKQAAKHKKVCQATSLVPYYLNLCTQLDI